MFVDRVQVEFHAGKGGDGCVSMRREKYVPRGGPDGGNGGRGGSIILESALGVNSLAALVGRSMIKAKNGQPGMGSMMHGAGAKDMVLKVPPGTTVIDAEAGFVVKDLKQPGEQFVVARGGRGGKGNAHFKSATNRAPREMKPGEEGEVRAVILELKSIADVGLVGKPNAGKSTLLSTLSSARPEIADYPFTTKHPGLGIVELDPTRSFVLADIPGLIEGASDGVGLGHEFLKHVERAGLLVHLVEPDPVDGTDPVENYQSIRKELEHYDAALGERDEILVVTKNEMPAAGAVAESLRDAAEKPVLSVSAATGDGLDELKNEIMSRVETRRTAMRAAGEDVTPLRSVDQMETKKRRVRVPPHKAGPTAGLSNQRQAKDFDGGAPDDTQRDIPS